MSGLRSALLLAATSGYFGLVWLLSGLPPLPFVASRVGGHRENDTESESAHQRKWRSNRA